MALTREFYHLLPNLTSEFESRFVCPAGDCRIPEHWSLATCGECQEGVTRDDTDMNCEYSYPSPKVIKVITDLQEFKEVVKLTKGEFYEDARLSCGVKRVREYIQFTKFANLSYPSTDDIKRFIAEKPYPTFNSTKNYWVDGTDGHRLGSNTTDTLLWLNEALPPPGFPSYNDLEDWKGPKFTTRRCRLKFCAKRTRSVKISKGRFSIEETTVPFDFSSKKCKTTDCLHYGAKPLSFSEPQFKIQMSARRVLAVIMEESLMDQLNTEYMANSTMEDVLKLLNTINYSFLRSEQNPKATKVYGTTLDKETYVRVRWIWAIFPCVIVVGSVLFLVLTILASSWGEQLYKGSVLTGYFHKVEGWDEKELESIEGYDGNRNQEKETYNGLKKRAHEIRVKLCRNDQGKLEFLRQRQSCLS